MEWLKIGGMLYIIVCMGWFMIGAIFQKTINPILPVVIALGDFIGVLIGCYWMIRAVFKA